MNSKKLQNCVGMVVGLLCLVGCSESWEELTPPHSPQVNLENNSNPVEMREVNGSYLAAAAPILSTVMQENGKSLEIYRSAENEPSYYYIPDQLDWRRSENGKMTSNVYIVPKFVPRNEFGFPLETQQYHGILGYEVVLSSSESQKSQLSRLQASARVLPIQEADVFQSAFLLWERERLPEKELRPTIFKEKLLPFQQDFSRWRLGWVLSGSLFLTEATALNFKALSERARRGRREVLRSEMATLKYCVKFMALGDIEYQDSVTNGVRVRDRKRQDAQVCSNARSLDELIPNNVIFEE